MAHLGWSFALSGCLAVGALAWPQSRPQGPTVATAWERREEVPPHGLQGATGHRRGTATPERPDPARRRGRLLPTLREPPASGRVVQPRSATGGLLV